MFAEQLDQLLVRLGHPVSRPGQREPGNQPAVAGRPHRHRDAAAVGPQLTALPGEPVLRTASSVALNSAGLRTVCSVNVRRSRTSARQSGWSASSTRPSAEACG